MKILALEFSSAQRSVAVADTRGVLSEIIETSGRGTNAMGMIDAALSEAKLEREQIDCLAVGLGPGSYTGIRTAISVAQGWQLVREVKLFGVSSADCLAVQAQEDGVSGRANVIINAQRGEFYVAGYEISSTGWKEIEPLKLAGPDAIPLLEKSGATFVGPEVTRWFESGKLLFPRAAAVATLVAGRGDVDSDENLEPIYLRETTFVKAPPPRVFL